MNGLSWVLYWISVADGVRAAAIVINVVAILGVIAAGIAGAITSSLATVDEDEQAGKVSTMAWRWFRRLVAVAVFASLAIVFTPNQRTLYLIAGSEIGETAVNSEDGQMVIDALRKKVRDYLGDLTEAAD